MDFSSFSLTLFEADSSFIVNILVILPCFLFSVFFISCVAKTRTHANVGDGGFDGKQQNTTGPTTGESTKSTMNSVGPTSVNNKSDVNSPVKEIQSNQPQKSANVKVENKQNVPSQPLPQKPSKKSEIKKDEQIKTESKNTPKIEGASILKKPVVVITGKDGPNPAKVSAGKGKKNSKSKKEGKNGIPMYSPEMDVNEDEETLQNVKSLEKDLEPSHNSKQ